MNIRQAPSFFRWSWLWQNARPLTRPDATARRALSQTFAASTQQPRRYNIQDLKEQMEGMEAREQRKYMQELGDARHNIDREAIRRRLRQANCSPTEFLKASIESGEASIGVVSVCLEAQWQAVEGQQFIARFKQKKENIATEILRYIWSREDLWLPLVSYDWVATPLLCYYAIQEGKDDLIFDWLGVKVDFPDFHWRNTLLRNLMDAHGMLGNRSADPAISTLLRAFQMQEAALEAQSSAKSDEAYPILTLDVRPAAIALMSVLVNGGQHYTSSTLFDEFVAFTSTCPGRTAPESEFAVARLALMHPRKPDDEPAMTFLRKVHRGEPTMVTNRENEKLQIAFRMTVRRTFLVANHKGNVENARWIKENFAAELGDGLIDDGRYITTPDAGLLIRKLRTEGR